MSAREAGTVDRLAAGELAVPGSLLLTGRDDPLLDRESRRLAAALLCPGGDPDRECGSCRRVLSGLHPDLLTVEPEGVQIRVDRVREAIAFGAGRPYEGVRRVARVLRTELLGLEGSNALLKSLEEPGAAFHWILTTTRPEALLATIRSRCAEVRVSSPSFAERERAWRSLGRSPEDAADLAWLDRETPDPTEEDLQAFRERRAGLAEALKAGLADGSAPALLLLAEALGKEEGSLFVELLIDTALAASGLAELVRHRPVAGVLQAAAARVSAEAFRQAALKAADPPADNRRGNRRLHFESLLLELWLARAAEKPA